MPNSTLIKFADDMTLTGLVTCDDESVYRNVIELLMKWSNDNNLMLDVDKTMELFVDLGKCRN